MFGQRAREVEAGPSTKLGTGKRERHYVGEEAKKSKK